MRNTVRFGDIVFNQSYMFANRNGIKLGFTRQERALLLAFTRRPHSLLTRGQLLDALPSCDETSDRNLDYLVNRLRAKLGDNARVPTFIATQYGEGYLWVADPVDDVPSNIFCVIGPVFGLNEGEQGSDAQKFLEHLHRALDS